MPPDQSVGTYRAGKGVWLACSSSVSRLHEWAIVLRTKEIIGKRTAVERQEERVELMGMNRSFSARTTHSAFR